MFTNPNPDCDKECRFTTESYSITTDMYFPPVYVKQGNNINPDGNIISTTIYCSVCGKSWNSSTQYGKTTYTEIK